MDRDNGKSQALRNSGKPATAISEQLSGMFELLKGISVRLFGRCY
jgi:hypothetical protein